MFKNLQLYRLPSGISATAAELEQYLSARRFQPCESNQLMSGGWGETHGGSLVYASDKQLLLTYLTEEKILPPAYVARVVAAKVAEIQEDQDRKVGRKEMRELKEQVTLALIPQAFTRMVRTPVWIDNANRWLCIDGSQARAEDVLMLLNRSLPMIPQIAVPKTAVSPASAMRGWLITGEAPDYFSIDNECELVMARDGMGKVKYSHVSIDTDEVRKRIEVGSTPTKLALTYNDHVSFILTEKLELRRLHLLDVITQQIDDEEDPFEANFFIAAKEIAALIAAVMEACGGEAVSAIDEAAKPKKTSRKAIVA